MLYIYPYEYYNFDLSKSISILYAVYGTNVDVNSKMLNSIPTLGTVNDFLRHKCTIGLNAYKVKMKNVFNLQIVPESAKNK